MGAPLTFGLGVNANETLSSIVEKSMAAETLGLKYVWIADSPVQLYGPVVAFAAAARTSRIRIGLGLMSVLVHTPRQIADAMATLCHAYGDRFDLCIGVGDRKQLNQVGVYPEKINNLPHFVLKAKQEIASHLDNARVGAKIWLGAQGPRMLGIAKNFDGVLLNYSNLEMIGWAIAEARLRGKRGFRIGIYSPSYVYVRRQRGVQRLAKVSSAVVAVGATTTLLRKFGLHEKLRRARELAKASPTIEAILHAVPHEVVKDFSITMQAAHLPSYIVKLKGLGVSHVVFAYPQNYSVETVRELGKALNLIP